MFVIGFIIGALITAFTAYSIHVSTVEKIFEEFTNDEEWK